MALRRAVLSLEGNIGSGKSTLLRLLRDKGRLQTIDEPVARWQSVTAPEDGPSESGTNLLELFYNDPKRWAFTFQTYAFLSRAQGAVENLERQSYPGDVPSNAAVVLERSLASDKHIFATNCLRTGLFTKGEWAVYSNYHDWTTKMHPGVHVDGFVYMRTQPSTCLDRCARRSRDEESSLGLDYLGQIHALHEDWLLHPPGDSRGLDLTRCRTKLGDPVLVVDCDIEFKSSSERSSAVVQAVRAFADEVNALNHAS